MNYRDPETNVDAKIAIAVFVILFGGIGLLFMSDYGTGLKESLLNNPLLWLIGSGLFLFCLLSSYLDKD